MRSSLYKFFVSGLLLLCGGDSVNALSKIYSDDLISTECTTDLAIAENFEVQLNPSKSSYFPGDEYTLTYSYKLIGGDILNGSTSTYRGTFNGFSIMNSVLSLCDELSTKEFPCPQYNNQNIIITSKQKIPDDIPSGNLRIRNEWKTATTQQQILCVTYNIDIISKTPRDFIDSLLNTTQTNSTIMTQQEKRRAIYHAINKYINNREESEIDIPALFEVWRQLYQITHPSFVEYFQQRAVFAENIRDIRKHNQNKMNSWYMGLGLSANVNKTRFFQQQNLNKQTCSLIVTPNYLLQYINDVNYQYCVIRQLFRGNQIPPKSFDWTLNSSAKIEIKNQEKCGACYAFQVVSAIEWAVFIKHNYNIKLSTNEIIYCSYKFGNFGCNGGQMLYTYNYVIQNGILPENAVLSYNSNKKTCNNEYHFGPRVSIQNYIELKGISMIDLMIFVQQQPVNVIIKYYDWDFNMYYDGVFRIKDCPNMNQDDIQYKYHLILIVGYGELESGLKYWKIQNSFGELWGKDGYMLIERSENFEKYGLCNVFGVPFAPLL